MSSVGGEGVNVRGPARTQAWSRVRDSHAFPQEVWIRGEPSLRPETGHLVLPHTAGMAWRENQFYGRALFVNIVGAKRVAPADLLAAMELQCGVHQSAQRCRWSHSARGTSGKMEYNTVLSIEGLPEEEWEPEAVNIILAGLDGHLVELLPAEDFWILPLKAWLRNPSDVPKMVTVTVPANVLMPTEQNSYEEGESPPPPSSPEVKRTQAYELIVHVKEVIDRGHLLTDGLSTAFLPDEGEDLSRRHVFKTWRGKIDGTGDGNFGEA